MKRPIDTLLEELKRAEKRSKKEFVKLDSKFYKETLDRFEELQIKLKEAVESNDIELAAKLNEELTKAKKSYDSFVDIRLKKLLAAVISPTISVKNLTKEEAQLYRDLKELVNSFIETVVKGKSAQESVVLKEEIVIKEDAVEEPKALEPLSEEFPNEEIAGDTEISNEQAKEANEERYVLARVIARSVKIALPSGRVLELKKEDVLHLPEKIYRILLKREKVVDIRPSGN